MKNAIIGRTAAFIGSFSILREIVAKYEKNGEVYQLPEGITGRNGFMTSGGLQDTAPGDFAWAGSNWVNARIAQLGDIKFTQVKPDNNGDLSLTCYNTGVVFLRLRPANDLNDGGTVNIQDMSMSGTAFIAEFEVGKGVNEIAYLPTIDSPQVMKQFIANPSAGIYDISIVPTGDSQRNECEVGTHRTTLIETNGEVIVEYGVLPISSPIIDVMQLTLENAKLHPLTRRNLFLLTAADAFNSAK